MLSEILFVDSEPNILKALRRSFSRDEALWRARFATSADEAHAILGTQKIDILVSEIRLPGKNGLELLDQVRKQYPRVARIIFSGFASRDIILKSAGIAHQYIAKPTDDDIIKSTLKQALYLRDLLANSTLEKVITQIGSLPSLPSLYVQIMEELRTEDPSITRIAEIVAQDPTMAAKLLQLVNSSFFGLPQRISNLSKAVSLLGIDLIRAVVLSAGIVKRFEGDHLHGFSIDDLWQHSLKTGSCAKAICQTEKLDRSVVDASFMAGLLHDIGKVILATKLPGAYAVVMEKVLQAGSATHEIEMEVLGAHHAQVGAYLLGLWGLPHSVLHAVAYHHNPSEAPKGDRWPLIAVHLANAFDGARACEANGDLEDSIPFERVDQVFLSSQDIQGKIDAWRSMCMQNDDGFDGDSK